jgi:uncharacterized protein (TIGR02246 family)
MREKLPSALAIALGLLAIGGCQTAPPTSQAKDSPFAAEAGRVHAVLERLIAADNAADVGAVLACYDPDVTLLPPKGDSIRGRAAAEAHYRALFARERLALEIGFGETMLSVDNATVLGTVKGQRKPIAGGASATVDDVFTAILVRGNDREWRVLQLAWKPGPPQR